MGKLLILKLRTGYANLYKVCEYIVDLKKRQDFIEKVFLYGLFPYI
jgi:hypothetical protein